MSRVYVVTDSAAVLQPDVADRLGITIVPLTVRLGGKDYEDKKDLSHEELMLRMAKEHIHPEIIGPTAEQFRRLYDRLTRRTDQIISLHSASHLSTVYRQAQLAAEGFLGRCDIVVMDSEAVSLGLGILVERAAELALQSMPLKVIVRHIRGMIQRVYTVFTTDTLHHLVHSKLISSTQAILGSMLGVKPFLAIEGGKLVPMEKVRSRERALDKLVEFANEFAGIDQLAILQSTSYPTAGTKVLHDKLDSIVGGRDYPTMLYGPLLASQIGADGIGLVVYEGEDRNNIL